MAEGQEDRRDGRHPARAGLRPVQGWHYGRAEPAAVSSVAWRSGRLLQQGESGVTLRCSAIIRQSFAFPAAMLFWFVIACWLISVAIGLVAATRVHNTGLRGGRWPPCPFRWSRPRCSPGSIAEAVLGIPATFLKEGWAAWWPTLRVVRALVLVGLFFAAALPHEPAGHRRLLQEALPRRGGAHHEVAIVISYLGWVGAQISRSGLVFNAWSRAARSASWPACGSARPPSWCTPCWACGRWLSPTSCR